MTAVITTMMIMTTAVKPDRQSKPPHPALRVSSLLLTSDSERRVL